MPTQISLNTLKLHNERVDDLLKKVEEGKIDPSFIITHRMKLSEAPEAYKKFRNKEDGCVKVVLTP